MLDKLEARHNKEFNDIHEVLDKLLKAKNEENQKKITKSQE